MTIDTTRGCLVVEAGQHAATLTTRPHTGVPITQVIIQRHTPYQDILDITIDAPAAAKLGAWLTQWADQHKQISAIGVPRDQHSADEAQISHNSDITDEQPGQLS